MLKNRFLSSGIILLLAITIAQARNVDGIWRVNRSGELVEIRSTDYGLMAKFLNDRDWDHYDRIRNDIFEDRRGNRYYVKTGSRITWESRDGRRVINLEKSNNSGRRSANRNYDYDYDYRERRNNRGGYTTHVCGTACAANCAMMSGRLGDGLSGKWTNRWRNLTAIVQYDGYTVRMKTNKSRKWTTYRRTKSRNLIFEDRWGNRLRFKRNGKLEWRRTDGRRNIDFVQDFY